MDMLLSDRYCVKTLFFDQITANNTDAIRAAINAFDRFVEFLDIIGSTLRLKEMFLPLHRIRSLLGSLKGEGLVFPVELTGRIHELLRNNIEFFARFGALLDDDLA